MATLAELDVGGLIHVTHSTGTEVGCDFVVGDSGADHFHFTGTRCFSSGLNRSFVGGLPPQPRTRPAPRTGPRIRPVPPSRLT